MSGRDGVVTLNLAPPADAHPSALTLDCADSAGTTMTYAFNVSVGPTYIPPPLPVSTVVWKTIPAIAGDPLSWSPTDLATAGYPPRPADPTSGSYARWLAHVSTPFRMVVNPTSVPTSTSTNDTNYGRYYLTNYEQTPWTGYYEAYMEWEVPYVQSSGNTVNVWDFADIWVGMDAFSSDLIQSGVQSFAEVSDGWYIWYYTPFYESLSDTNNDGSSQPFLDLDISTFDNVSSFVWTCTGGGNYDVVTTSYDVEACFCLYDWTALTSECSQLHINPPYNTFGQASVFFTLERRGVAHDCFYEIGTLYQELPYFQNSDGYPIVSLTNLEAWGGDYSDMGYSDTTVTTDGTSGTTALGYSLFEGYANQTVLGWENYGTSDCWIP